MNNPYNLTMSELRLIESWMVGKSYEGVFDWLLTEMDCTIVLPIGRPMQTINTRYQFLQIAYEYIINNVIDSNRYTNEQIADFRKLLEERHQANLAYEKEHPPVQYDSKGKGTKVKASDRTKKVAKVAKSYRTKDLISGETVDIPITPPKRETIKDRKTKALAAKFANMKYNFNAKPDED